MLFVFRTNEQRGILESSLNAVCFCLLRILPALHEGYLIIRTEMGVVILVDLLFI